MSTIVCISTGIIKSWNTWRHRDNCESRYYFCESVFAIMCIVYGRIHQSVSVLYHISNKTAQPSAVRCRYNAVNYLTNIHNIHPIVPVIINVVYYNFGPRYNGTLLYIEMHHWITEKDEHLYDVIVQQYPVFMTIFNAIGLLYTHWK